MYGLSADPSDASAGITAFDIIEIIRAADKISARFFLIILFLPLYIVTIVTVHIFYYFTNTACLIVGSDMKRRFLITNGKGMPEKTGMPFGLLT